MNLVKAWSAWRLWRRERAGLQAAVRVAEAETAMLIHELQTPLLISVSSLRTLRRRGDLCPETVKLIDSAAVEIENLRRLLDSHVMRARYSRGLVSPEAIEATWRSYLEMVGRRGQHGIQVESEAPPTKALPMAYYQRQVWGFLEQLLQPTRFSREPIGLEVSVRIAAGGVKTIMRVKNLPFPPQFLHTYESRDGLEPPLVVAAAGPAMVEIQWFYHA